MEIDRVLGTPECKNAGRSIYGYRSISSSNLLHKIIEEIRTALATIHSLLITVGIYVGAVFASLDGNKTSYAFGIIPVFAISLLSVIPLFFVGSLDRDTEERQAHGGANGREHKGYIVSATLSIIALQILQQLSGINGLIMNRDVIFSDSNGVLLPEASLPMNLFVFSGIAGSIISSLVILFHKKFLRHIFAISAVGLVLAIFF